MAYITLREVQLAMLFINPYYHSRLVIVWAVARIVNANGSVNEAND